MAKEMREAKAGAEAPSLYMGHVGESVRDCIMRVYARTAELKVSLIWGNHQRWR